jgi:SAM-dependent methyltransferase
MSLLVPLASSPSVSSAAPGTLGWLARQPDFLAVLDLPATTDVRSHTHQVARFSGWIGSSRTGDLRVRVFVRGREWVELPAREERSDVAQALQATQPIEHMGGFDFYVDLPPALVAPLPIELELSDGTATVRTPTLWINPTVDISLLDTHVAHSATLQRLAQRLLRGRGLEFGALHLPLEVDRARTVMSYADRHRKQDALALFGELQAGYADSLVEVDHVVNLDRDDLSALEPHGFDFFIANGVIEHLVNPLRFLHHLHRIMKPGARFFLAAPDRDFTFDTRRSVTPLEHLLAEYEADETTLSDAHIEEALLAVDPDALPDDPAARRTLLEHHRTRSVHAHVWDQRSFDELLDVARQHLGIGLRILAREPSRKSGGNCVYVLEKD